MDHIHYEDENSRYITMGCTEKVEDPVDYSKEHLARIPDYLWVAEDGMKMQTFGSQEWDTGFAVQALLASDLADEIGPWILDFSDQDHGWQVSDYTAEVLKSCLLFSMMPPDIVGAKMELEKLYDYVNLLFTLHSKNGGVSTWEPVEAQQWLEVSIYCCF
ncbi:hypothetical protein Patl1_30972 [Pistacia atlantica]|uniref:Uncharacterized protein n=1 Tax=Pistacia atlantica TaxID=434234 RepID=A0ACC1AEF1_9ROSI|nr:hypothetical protein Patl1_30972 [Pistacia atlantica]